MFTGAVGRIRMDVDVVTTGAMAKVKALAEMIEGIGDGQRGPVGDLFTKQAKSFKQLGRESDKVYQSINGLITRSYFLQAAISGVVPVVAQLVGGLFALGSQAAAAAPALIVLPGIMTAMMQAAITAKLALGGVFKAVGELGKAKTPAVDQMPAKLEAFRNAQERVRRAQEGLNRAYKEAAERIQQLGFDTEDAAIAQERAALALEDARNTLARVQDLPPNSRARQEAELAFKEADLNYRRAIDRSNDLTEEQDRVTQNGTLNADQQVAQSEEVLNAQRQLRDSVLDLKKAQDNLNKSQGNGAGLTEFNKLSKAAQEFAKYLVSLKPEIQKLKDAAGEELFGPLQSAVKNLVDNFFPRLQPLLRETGKALGKTALDFSKIVTEANNLANFEKVGKTNIDTIGKLGTVVGNLYSAFLSLLAAADPLIRRFTDWVVTLTGGWKATSEANNQSGKLAKTFDYAGDVAANLGDIIGNLMGALMNMGKAASGPGSGGEMILTALENWSQKWETLTKKMMEDGSLQDYFRQSSEGFMKVAGIIGKIVKIILKSATQEGTGEFLDSISRAVDTLGVGFTKLSGSAPAFGKFIEEFARMTVAFMEAGSIKVFFETLGAIVSKVADIFENEFVVKMLTALAVMHGAKLALLVVRNAFKTLAFYVIGMMRTVIIPLKYIFGLLTTTLGMTSGAAIGLMAGVAALIAVLILAWKNSKIFRDSLADLGGKVLGALSKAFTDIKETAGKAFESIFGKGTGVRDVFKEIGDFIGKYIVPVFSYLLPKSIASASVVFQGLINVVAGVAVVIKGVFKIIKGVFALFTGDFSGFLDLFGAGFMDVFGGLGKAIAGIFSSIFAPIRIAFGDIFGVIAEKAAPIARVFKPILDIIVKIAKIVRTVLYVGFLVAFTAIGIVIAETWRLIKRIGTAIIDNIAMPVIKVALPAIKISFGIIKKIFETTFKVLAVVAGVVFIGVQIAVKLLWSVFKKYFSLILSFYKTVFGVIKTVFEAVWPVIWGGIKWAWENVIKKAFENIRDGFALAWGAIKAVFNTVWPVIWGAIQFAWNNIIKPVFREIFEAFQFYWGIIKTVFDFVWPYIWKGIQFAWNNVIKPIFNMLGTAFSFIFNNVILPVFNLVWPLIWGGIKFAWENVIKPVFNLIGSVFSTIWNGIKAAFDLVWPLIWGSIQFAWENVIKPVFGKIGSVFSAVWDGVKAAFGRVWDGIKLAFTDFPQFIRNVFNNAIKFFNGFFRGIVDAFKSIPSVFAKVWDKVIGLFRGGVNLLIKGFNNTLGGKKFKVPGWLGGGTFGFDKIPELGSGQAIDVEQIVTGGYRDIPGLALGGTIMPRPGGSLFNIAEAGRPERVEPLDPDGLSKRDKAMIKLLSGGAAGGITINVHPSPGMNEVELAALVNRQLAFELRKGAA